VVLSRVLLGKDGAGRPTAEFSVILPPGWRKGSGEELTVRFDCQGQAPWACRAEVSRRLGDGAFLTLSLEPAPVLYDFGASGARASLALPWDGDRYRVTLVPVSGAPPLLRGISGESAIPARVEGAEVRLSPSVESLPAAAGQGCRLRLEAPERVVGLTVLLEPPAAPLVPGVTHEGAPQAVSGLIWNLPALDTVATHLTLGPLSASSLDLTLPEGARLKRAEVLVRREVLVFPAEAGKTYYLHGGGGVRTAPGALDGLTGAGSDHPAPLALGPSEPDPQGIPLAAAPGSDLRSWLPWAAGVVAVLLALVALRLFKQDQ
jgi:hypothetical protein